MGRADRIVELLLDTLYAGFVLPHTTTTILHDWIKGRHSEVDDINGLVVAEGARHGIPAPVNAAAVEVAIASSAATSGLIRQTSGCCTSSSRSIRLPRLASPRWAERSARPERRGRLHDHDGELLADSLALRMTACVGILAAIDRELEAVLADFEGQSTERVFGRTFHRGVLHGRKAVAVVAGIGKTAVATTTTLLLQRFGVDRIVLFGVAGQVSEDLGVGDVVVATHVLHHDLDASPIFPRYQIPSLGTARLDTDAHLSSLAHDAATAFIANEHGNGGQVARGLILSGDQFMKGPQLAELRGRFPDALAVEMEGAAAAQVCVESGTPYAIVRAISDAGGADDFQRFVRDRCAAYARGIIGGLLTAIP